MKASLFILFNVLFFIATTLTSSQSLYTFDVRPFNSGSRIAAMGGGATGEAYDVNGMYLNPATLCFINKTSIIISSKVGAKEQSLDNTLTLSSISLGNSQFLAIGAEGSVYGERWSSPFFAYNGIDIAYAVKLDPTLSAGIITNIRLGSSVNKKLWGTNASIGLYYAPSPGISYGVAYDGIGSGMKYSFDNRKNETLVYNNSIERNIRIGTAFKFPSVFRAPYMFLTMESQKTIGQKGVTYKAGIESLIADFLSLRSGIVAARKGTIGTFGIGITIGRIQLDYALSPSHVIDRFHQISISYNTGN